jgi:ABC-type glycerol-3-phosphate transport system substrate-binding protein
VSREQYATTIQTQMAGGVNLPDIVQIGALDITIALNLGYQGTIVNLTPLIEKYSNGNINAFLDDYNFANKITIAPDGSRYWFVGVSRFIFD